MVSFREKAKILDFCIIFTTLGIFKTAAHKIVPGFLRKVLGELRSVAVYSIEGAVNNTGQHNIFGRQSETGFWGFQGR